MDKSYIKGILQQILNSEFSNQEKRKIQDCKSYCKIACIYCGDSSTNIRAKRGTFYFDKLFYCCFNDGCNKKTTFIQLCKDFNLQLDPDKKLEMSEFISKNKANKSFYQESLVSTQLTKLLDMEEITKMFNTYDTPISDFKPIEKDSYQYYYLINKRNIPEKHLENIYQANYWRNDESHDNIICFLNRRGNKLLGMQVRNLKNGKQRYFKIFNYETLYKWLHKIPEDEKIKDFDENELMIYNKLSYYFNIMNIDFGSKLTVLEGFIDSLYCRNSVALIGVNTDTSFLEKNCDVQYLFDNDKAGFKKSEQKLKQGFPIFLWKKMFEDIIKERNSKKDPYKMMNTLISVKDLAEFNNYGINVDLDKYFSKDVYDLKYLPKTVYQKKKFVPYNK